MARFGTGSVLACWLVLVFGPLVQALPPTPQEQLEEHFYGALATRLQVRWEVPPRPIRAEEPARIRLILEGLDPQSNLKPPLAWREAFKPFVQWREVITTPVGPNRTIHEYELIPHGPTELDLPELPYAYLQLGRPPGQRLATTYADSVRLTVIPAITDPPPHLAADAQEPRIPGTPQDRLSLRDLVDWCSLLGLVLIPAGVIGGLIRPIIRRCLARQRCAQACKPQSWNRENFRSTAWNQLLEDSRSIERDLCLPRSARFLWETLSEPLKFGGPSAWPEARQAAAAFWSQWLKQTRRETLRDGLLRLVLCAPWCLAWGWIILRAWVAQDHTGEGLPHAPWLTPWLFRFSSDSVAFLPQDVWAPWLGLATVGCMLALAWLTLRIPQVHRKRTRLALALVWSLALFLGFLRIGFFAQTEATWPGPRHRLSTEPSAWYQGPGEFYPRAPGEVVTAGTPLRLIRVQPGWSFVETPSGSRGWLRSPVSPVATLLE